MLLLCAALLVGLCTGLLVHAGDLGDGLTFPPFLGAVGMTVAGAVALRARNGGRGR